VKRQRLAQLPARFQPAIPRDPRPPEAPREQPDRRPISPWMDTEQIAALICRPSRKAVRQWARRRGLVAVRCGARLLYARRDIEATLRAEVRRDLPESA
jgi:hypothetical protein